MPKRIKLKAVVGRQRITKNTPVNQRSYVRAIQQQMKGIVDNYEKLVSETEKASPEILEQALQPTFELSQKYVPVDTQALKNSGFLRSEGDRVVIGYGLGGNPAYTVFVHERVDLKHDAPTRSKFLLSALEEDEGNIQQRIVKGYEQLTGLNKK